MCVTVCVSACVFSLSCLCFEFNFDKLFFLPPADCGKEFKLKAHLARHIATAHGVGGNPPGAVPSAAGTGGAISGVSSPVTGAAGGSSGVNGRAGSAATGPGGVMKTRVAFCLVTTPLCRAARRIAKQNYRAHRAACHPFAPIDTAAIVQVRRVGHLARFSLRPAVS